MGSSAAKKARTADVSDYKWTEGERAVVCSLKSNESHAFTYLVPVACLHEYLKVWLRRCMADKDPTYAKITHLNVSLTNPDDNEPLLEYLKNKDIEGADDDPADKDPDDEEDEDDEDDEIEDVSDVLDDIDKWVQTHMKMWSYDPQVNVKVICFMNFSEDEE